MCGVTWCYEAVFVNSVTAADVTEGNLLSFALHQWVDSHSGPVCHTSSASPCHLWGGS